MTFQPRGLVWNVVPSIVVLGIMYLAVFGDDGMFRRIRMHAELEKVERRLASMQEENLLLEREVDQLRNDPVTQKRAAAEELLLVPPGSTVHRFP